jgi:nicotinamidase-related amidase
MSKFTRDNTALVLIDHQVGTMQLVKNLDVAVVKSLTIALAKMAKILNIPTVITSSQEDNVQGAVIAELAEILPDAFKARIQRVGIVNAWDDPAFKAAVKATGRPNLIMAGITTDVCLIFPAIDAVTEGFGVQAVLDASGSPTDLSEEMARQRMQNAGVVLTATNTLIAEVAQEWSSPEGQQLITLLFTDVFPTLGAGISA